MRSTNLRGILSKHGSAYYCKVYVTMYVKKKKKKTLLVQLVLNCFVGLIVFIGANLEAVIYITYIWIYMEFDMEVRY
jgi:hypothetical protein